LRVALRSLARFSADLHTMPYLQLDGQRITLEIGEVTIGSGEGAGVKVAGAGDATAILRVGPDLQSSVRRSGDSAVRVNSVQLGAEPTPLIHGDKIEVGGAELFFGDDRMAGSTQYISAANLPQRSGAAPARTARRTQASGGRLVSLVDGREYAIPAGGLVIGRDASCDVVVPTAEVSRRHAEIAPSNEGYVLKDTSTNGVFVNGERVSVTQTLGRGDIVRVGNEDFRFYADLVVAVTPPDVTPTPAEPTAAAEAARAAASIRSAPAELPADEAPAAPASAHASVPASGAGAPTPIIPPRSITTPPASGRPVLATLEVLSTGVLKGQRFEVRSPLAHVGRGAHNDVVLPDESVSDAHAKLQKRETGWYVVDMGSTNGTYVGGRRVETEYKLEGAPDLRFGGVKVAFRADEVGVAHDDVKGTRAFSMPRGARAPQSTKPSAPVVAPGAEDPEAPTKGRGFPLWLWLAVVMLLALGAFFIYEQSR
jgi:pSer/pThr/pTyr-binding forkhead associated (FHA) protein